MPNPIWLALGGLGALGAAAAGAKRLTRRGFLPKLGRAVCGTTGEEEEGVWRGTVVRAGVPVDVELSKAREEGFAYIRLVRPAPANTAIRFEVNGSRDSERIWIPATFSAWQGTLSVGGEQVSGSGLAILKPTLEAKTFEALSKAARRLECTLVHLTVEREIVEAHLFVPWKAEVDQIAPVVRYTLGTIADLGVQACSAPALWSAMLGLGALGSATRLSLLETLLRHHRESEVTRDAIADAMTKSHAAELATLADKLGAGIYAELAPDAFVASLRGLEPERLEVTAQRLATTGMPVDLLRLPGMGREVQQALYSALRGVWADGPELRLLGEDLALDGV